jgi:hypothetical protein
MLHFSTVRQRLFSKHRGKLLKEILFPAVPHKAAIMHRNLEDFHFEVPKHPAHSPDCSDYYLFLNLKKHLKHWGGHISCGQVDYSTTKRIFLG